MVPDVLDRKCKFTKAKNGAISEKTSDIPDITQVNEDRTRSNRITRLDIKIVTRDEENNNVYRVKDKVYVECFEQLCDPLIHMLNSSLRKGKIENTLSFRHHADYICERISQKLAVLSRINPYVSRHVVANIIQ